MITTTTKARSTKSPVVFHNHIAPRRRSFGVLRHVTAVQRCAAERIAVLLIGIASE